ncbi:MAG: hypothetical protein RIM99_03985 [Cyclobacteriaceae bacterium]
MELKVREVSTKKEIKEFVKFQIELYKGNPFYVPPLLDFELSTLLKEKNPAFDHADAKYWVAEKKGKIVGKIAAIVLDEELKNKSLARFGWIDFVDDKQVSNLLFETAADWVTSKGATAIHGPIGFTDLDFEGALIEGFDELATQATIYNHPYYIDHYRTWGLEASATWSENRLKMPDEVPERLEKGARIVSERYGIQVKKFKKAREIKKYANGVFDVLNDAYSHLYGYHKLTQKQIDYYVDQYFGMVRKDFVKILVDREDKVIGFAISLPSLSRAFQKAKGSLFPFGFIHVLRAFQSNKHVDLFLIGVLPDYQKLGASAVIIHELTREYIKRKVELVTSGPMLEDNSNVLMSWKDYELLPGSIRRSCFIKKL